jgi:hypothetical protein
MLGICLGSQPVDLGGAWLGFIPRKVWVRTRGDCVGGTREKTLYVDSKVFTRPGIRSVSRHVGVNPTMRPFSNANASADSLLLESCTEPRINRQSLSSSLQLSVSIVRCFRGSCMLWRFRWPGNSWYVLFCFLYLVLIMTSSLHRRWFLPTRSSRTTEAFVSPPCRRLRL